MNISFDKIAHFWSGMAICLAMSLFIHPLIALGITIGIGIAKEVWDKIGNGTPEVLDAVATGIGGIVGFLLSFIAKI